MHVKYVELNILPLVWCGSSEREVSVQMLSSSFDRSWELRGAAVAEWSRNEKVSNQGSIPITIDCNVVAFIVFEEGFHQPIKRTKQYLLRLVKFGVQKKISSSLWLSLISIKLYPSGYGHELVVRVSRVRVRVPLKTRRVEEAVAR
ncbi:hypothetical protein TNCV_3543921 [Trichonephila clavipes]|nr:hypothetical protein TNCV_3543921 [Trichonephila clavipes]